MIKYIMIAFECSMSFINGFCFDKPYCCIFDGVVCRVHLNFIRMHLQIVVVSIKGFFISISLFSAAMENPLSPFAGYKIGILE